MKSTKKKPMKKKAKKEKNTVRGKAALKGDKIRYTE